MTKEEKIKLIEETLDVDNGTLTESAILSELPQYDSMSKLAIIVMFDDEFSKKLTGERLKEFVTVGDILDFMD